MSAWVDWSELENESCLLWMAKNVSMLLQCLLGVLPALFRERTMNMNCLIQQMLNDQNEAQEKPG